MQNNLKISQKLTEIQIAQLIAYSNSDPLIIINTNDKERFKNRTSFKEWLRKKRKIYCLTDKNKNLLGIIWFGIKQIPKEINLENFNISPYSITFSIRLYANARGKGLSQGFIKKALELYKKTNEYLENPQKGMWLVTNSDNIGAIKTYEKIGFKFVGNLENGRIFMILS